MGFYEDFIQKVEDIGADAEDIIAEVNTDMEAVNDNIRSAKEALEAAYQNGDASEYMRLKAVIEMNEIRLTELKQQLKTMDVDAPMTAAEHKQLVDELKNHTIDEVAGKYRQLSELLKSGAAVLSEMDEIIRKYYRAFTALDSKVLDFETDNTGAKYRTFSSADTHKKLNDVEQVFYGKGIHSIRYALEHAIKSKVI